MELIIAIFALAACTIFCGIGSAIGLYKTGSAASAVIGEDPKKFSKVLVLAVLPATQGIYGFVITIIGTAKIAAVAAGTASGMALLGAILPITVVGCISAIFQGKTSVNAILAVAKEDSISGKMMLFPAMVETYAILAFVITLMLFNAI